MKPFNKILSIILIFGVGIIGYSNTFFCSFHYDDKPFILQNLALRNIYNLQNIWNYWHSRFVTFVSLALNYHFNGLNVFGYHVFNLGVHLLSACFVWWLTLLTLSTPAMTGNKISQHARLIALFAGLIFVSHPVQVEGVTYIWQRAACMMALFYMASLCFYIKSRLLSEAKPRPGGADSLRQNFFYIASLLTAVVAMFTKENAVTLPLMILLYEFTFLKTKRSMDWSSFRTLVVTQKHLFPFLLTLFIIPVTMLFVKLETFQKFHGDLKVAGGVITPMQYFLTQFRAMFTYIRLLFLPVNLNFEYDYPVYKSIFQLPVLFSFFFLVSIFYGAIRLFSQYRLISFSIFWFFLTLIIPESSFWPMGDLILEHRLYLPMAGYSIFLVASVYYLGGKNSIKMMVMVLSLIVACNSFLTYQRNKVWRDEFTLWGDTIKKSPHKPTPYINRGLAHIEQGEFAQAISDYTRAIEINPKDAGDYSNRGNAYNMLGNLPQAVWDYTRAIEINPEDKEAYNNRAVTYYQLNEPDKARADIHKVEELTSQH